MIAQRFLLDTTDDISRRLAMIVAGVARRSGLAEREAYRLRLAADEIATNVVNHGYRHGPGVLHVVAGSSADWVWLRLEDSAPPFDPRMHETAPTVDGPPREGGYGIFLAQKSVDCFEYDYARTARRNRTTLLMRRPGSQVSVGVDATCTDTVGVEDGGTDGGQHRIDRC
jgi:anti-sigma regulatory factor (Ser/Thr protein kinase)